MARWDLRKLRLPRLLNERLKEKRFKMRLQLNVITLMMLLSTAHMAVADNDTRQMVNLPERMQQHMLSNMRDHLVTINSILVSLESDHPDQAADVAESRLGMSSLESHGASHMAKFMPEAMRQAGTTMHRAASRFALKAREGDVLAAYKTLSEVTSACVACHSAYRIR